MVPIAPFSVNAYIHAKVGGVIGVAVLVFFKVSGRSTKLTLEENAPMSEETPSS